MRKLSFGIIVISLLALFAIPVSAQEGNILQIVQGRDDLSLLAQAVETADPSIAETLSGSGPLTLFAPNDTAFQNAASFLEMDLDDLMSREDILTMLAQYHTVEGSLFTSQLIEGGEVGQSRVIPTLLENTGIGVIVNEDDSLTLNSVVEIEEADIEATNGVVHVINDVLLSRVINEELERQEQLAMADTINVRFAHFTQDAPETVDVYLNSEAQITGLEFGQISDWLTIPALTYSVVVTPAGASMDETVLGPADVDLIEGSFTVAIITSVEDLALTTQVVLEDFSEVGEDSARVTVFHAVDGAPAVDVLADGEAQAFGVAYPGFLAMEEMAAETPEPGTEEAEEAEDANDGFEVFDISAGTYNVTLVPAGEAGPVLLDLGDIDLDAGNYYFVGAFGTADSLDFVIAETTGDQAAEMRGGDGM